MTDQAVAPPISVGRGRKWAVLISLLAGLFAVNFTFTVFVVAFPTIKSEFHTDFSVLTWVSTGPLLAFGLAAPLFGKIGDIFGHRRLYMMGLIGAMVAALASALAPNIWCLIFARCLDGVQGAATGTASMALLFKTFPPAERVKTMGWWTMIGAGSPVVGVSLGGPIIQYLGWRDLFFIQLGLLVVSLVVVHLVLRRLPGIDAVESDTGTGAGTGAGRGWQQMDWIGSWSLSGTVTGAMLALSIGPIVGWSSPWTIASALGSLGSIAIFVHRERTAEHPLIPPKYFRRRNFMFPMGTRTFINFAYFGAFFLFPLYMEEVHGWGITKVSLVSIARPLVFSISSPIAGYVAVRIGERVSAVAGSACVVASMVVFAVLWSHPPLWLILVALALSGLGMGVAMPSLSSSQANEVAPSEYGVMSATQLLALQVGEVAGIQAVITIQESLAGHAKRLALLPSFHDAFWVGAGVGAAGLFCSIFIRSMHRVADRGATFVDEEGWL